MECIFAVRFIFLRRPKTRCRAGRICRADRFPRPTPSASTLALAFTYDMPLGSHRADTRARAARWVT
ncbi:hypothetical protein SNOUR_39640 [Streptomyces noursei ATCC 11455]|nr:hypothetical protein SNOUR_39640 [Streptomyces noursei ATCC 11455]